MSDLLESLGIHPYQAPQPLKPAGTFEPTKLFNVVDRLSTWTETPITSGSLMQVREDVAFLLASHLDYYQRYQKWEAMYWYQQDKEDNGNIAISWRERAEEMERKLKAAKSVLWMARQYVDQLAPGSEATDQAAYRMAAVEEILES